MYVLTGGIMTSRRWILQWQGDPDSTYGVADGLEVVKSLPKINAASRFKRNFNFVIATTIVLW